MSTMATEHEYFSYQKFGNLIKGLYEKYGKIMLEDQFFGLSDVQIGSNKAVLTFSWGGTETLYGNFNTSSNQALLASTITRVEDSVQGETGFSWQGQMTVAQFIDGEWGNASIMGNSLDNLIKTFSGSTAIAGDGNDYLVFDYGGQASGGAGMDIFIAPNRGNTQSTILDYQAGDKIALPDFDSIEHLVSKVVAVRDVGTGFAVDFKTPEDGSWSLIFANIKLNQLHIEDVLTGNAAEAALQPLVDAFGPAFEPYFMS